MQCNSTARMARHATAAILSRFCARMRVSLLRMTVTPHGAVMFLLSTAFVNPTPIPSANSGEITAPTLVKPVWRAISTVAYAFVIVGAFVRAKKSKALRSDADAAGETIGTFSGSVNCNNVLVAPLQQGPTTNGGCGAY